MYKVLNPCLYQRNIRLFSSRGLWAAVELGSESAVLKFIAYGANADQWTQVTPERRQREAEVRKKNTSAAARRWFGYSSSESSFSDDFHSLPSHSDSVKEEEEESTQSSETGSESGRGKHIAPSCPIDNASTKPLDDESRYKDEPQTPLVYLAASQGHTRIVQILPEHGVHLDAREESDATPLMVATDRGNVELVILLLQKGASLNARNCVA